MRSAVASLAACLALACTGRAPVDEQSGALGSTPPDAPVGTTGPFPIDALPGPPGIVDAPSGGPGTAPPDGPTGTTGPFPVDAPAAPPEPHDASTGTTGPFPVDAPLDAAVDASDLVDAPTAPPTFVWPAPLAIPPSNNQIGSFLAAAAGPDRIGFGLFEGGPAMFIDVYAPERVMQRATSGHPFAIAATPGGTFAFNDPRDFFRIVDSATGRSVVLTNPVDGGFAFIKPLVGEHGGGVLCVATGGTLHRITPAFTRDVAFGDGGTVVLGSEVVASLAQRSGSQSVVTIVTADDLVRRIDGITGAPIGAFGGTGSVAGAVPLGFPSARLLALAPLANRGVAVVERLPDAIVIHRVSALGAPSPPQLVLLGAQPVDAGVDSMGRITIRFAPLDGDAHLMRVDATTGALDLSFGSGGRATVRPAFGRTWKYFGVMGNGHVALAAEHFEFMPMNEHDYTEFYMLPPS